MSSADASAGARPRHAPPSSSASSAARRAALAPQLPALLLCLAVEPHGAQPPPVRD
eukprot:gene569-6010_t